MFREGATTTFLDLPTEIRYAIYGCILEEEDPIMLKMISRQGAPREIARYGNHRDIRHRGEVYDASLRQWVPAPPTHTAIMFVNHQVGSSGRLGEDANIDIFKGVCRSHELPLW